MAASTGICGRTRPFRVIAARAAPEEQPVDPLTTRERMTRAVARRQADRVPIMDALWRTTIERWRQEGLPEDVSWESADAVGAKGGEGA